MAFIRLFPHDHSPCCHHGTVNNIERPFRLEECKALRSVLLAASRLSLDHSFLKLEMIATLSDLPISVRQELLAGEPCDDGSKGFQIIF
jgi:hypothetical protein